MLRQAKEFKSFKLRATDGDIGKAIEFYFDDKHWTVRHLIADTGGWLPGRQVLISPYALSPVDKIERVFPVNLTKKQIEESPLIESDKPVSHQFETELYDYYGWPTYWYGSSSLGFSPNINDDPDTAKNRVIREKAWDHNLRSTQEVTGYHVHAKDGMIGHIEEFIIDEDTWSIRYLVIDTIDWWPAKHVLISPQWIEEVSWAKTTVFVNVSREKIKMSAEYSPESLNRDYETELHKHYGHAGYWDEERGERKSH